MENRDMKLLSAEDRSDLFMKEWNKIEKVATYPHHLRNVVIISADEFVDQVFNASPQEIKDLVKSIYSGDAYLLKNAFSVEMIEEIKDKVIEWCKTNIMK